MDNIRKYLFLCTTGVGNYYVVADNILQAQLSVQEFLDAANYGYSDNRKVTNIEILAESATDIRFICNKFLIV